MVGLSVGLGSWLVSNAGHVIPVWSAARTLTPGETFRGAVVALDVSPNLVENYLPSSEPLDGVAARVIPQGELIPRAAVIPEQEVVLRTVVVPVGTRLASTVVAGSRVDLWLAPEEEAQATLVLEDLVVRQVAESQSGFMAGSGPAVELLVAEGEVGRVLTAMNEGGTMHLVPRSRP